MQILWRAACQEEIIAHPSVIHAIFAQKNHAPKVCRYKKNEKLKDTPVDKGGAEMFTLNTPKKS